LTDEVHRVVKVVGDNVSDISVPEPNGEVVSSFSDCDHESIADAFVGNVPKPRGIMAVGDTGVDRNDEWGRWALEKFERFVPSGWVFGE
jgi:hypothetical protein